jgi:hypothetical protein
MAARYLLSDATFVPMRYRCKKQLLAAQASTSFCCSFEHQRHLVLIARRGCHVNWRQVFFMLFGDIPQMASTVVLTVCCPKPANQDLPYDFLIYHTFVSVRQFHLDNLGVRTGQEVINVPPKLFSFLSNAWKPSLQCSSWHFPCKHTSLLEIGIYRACQFP